MNFHHAEGDFLLDWVCPFGLVSCVMCIMRAHALNTALNTHAINPWLPAALVVLRLLAARRVREVAVAASKQGDRRPAPLQIDDLRLDVPPRLSLEVAQHDYAPLACEV